MVIRKVFMLLLRRMKICTCRVLSTRFCKCGSSPSEFKPASGFPKCLSSHMKHMKQSLTLDRQLLCVEYTDWTTLWLHNMTPKIRPDSILTSSDKQSLCTFSQRQQHMVLLFILKLFIKHNPELLHFCFFITEKQKTTNITQLTIPRPTS